MKPKIGDLVRFKSLYGRYRYGVVKKIGGENLPRAVWCNWRDTKEAAILDQDKDSLGYLDWNYPSFEILNSKSKRNLPDWW